MKYSLLAILSLLTLPVIALAGGSEGYVPLVGIPGLTGQPRFDDYIDALYALAISVAALIAVIQIVIGGAQYMMDDLITSKSAAKERIKNALIGLLIIIAAALILTTINSDLTRLEISAPVIEVDNSRPDPVEAINRAEQAITRNTQWVESNCPSYGGVSGVIGNACQSECNTIQGSFSFGVVNHTCSYAQDIADQCNPQQTFLCCETIKGGDWDVENRSCTGFVTDSERRNACYTRRSNWDETTRTCRTNACNRNTDAACCSLGYNGTLANGICNTENGPPALPPVNTGTLNNALSGLPQGMIDSISARVQDNIGGANYISNTSDINSIISENGAEGVYVAARIPNGIGEETRTALIRNTVEGICNDIGVVNSNAGVVEGELSDGTRYIACAR
ncbi:MAG: hypothetical protein ACK4SL_04170 [Candidatus Paceibacteria bacterium]